MSGVPDEVTSLRPAVDAEPDEAEDPTRDGRVLGGTAIGAADERPTLDGSRQRTDVSAATEHEVRSRSGSSPRLGATPSPGTSSSRSPSSSVPSSSRTLRGSGVLQPATVVGDRYEILGVLGEGGMGVVYEVRDRELDKVIALKTIRGEKDEDPEVVQRFKQELLLARRITHKNVVRIYDFGQADGLRFFTMELVPGESLKQVIRRRGRLPWLEVVALGRQVLRALNEAHGEGVVHRDLKPQNIMVDAQGTVRVMDFGIARATDSTGLTAVGAVLGTPDYASPEQVQGKRVDARSDLFSLGVILFEMLTGKLPYSGDSAAARMMRRISHRAPAVRRLAPETPPWLEAVVAKCLERDPELRYASAEGVLEDFDREQVERSLTLRARRTVTRSRGRMAAAAAALLLVAAGGYLALRPARPASAPAAATAPAEPSVTLAVLPFTNATGDAGLEWMRSGLPEMLVTDLAQSPRLRVVPGDRVYGVLTQLGLADQARFDDAALERVARLTRAEAVLHGQFVASGGRLRVDLSVRRTGTGVPIPVKVEGAPGDVFRLTDEITGQLKRALELEGAGEDRPVSQVATSSIDALRHYQTGLAALRRGTDQPAMAALDEATRADPGFALAYARLADAALRLGQRTEAEAAIRRASQLAEERALPLPDRYRIHATAALVKDDYETAAASFLELSRLFPGDPDVELSLGQANEELGRLPAAIEAYGRVLQVDPSHGAALLGLGRAQVLAGRYDEAVRTLESTLAAGTAPSDPEALGMLHSILGVAYRDTGRLDQALDHFERSFEFRGRAGDRRGQAQALSNAGTVHDLRGEPKKAIAAHEKALAIAREMGDRAKESNYLVEIGMIHQVQGDLDRALQAYRESMRIETARQDAIALANRLDHVADVYRLKGQYEDALVYLQQAQTHLAGSSEKTEQAINLNHLGTVRLAQGHYGPALEALQAALPLFQESGHETGVATVHHHLAKIYAQQGRYADACRSLDRAVEIHRRLKGKHGVEEVSATRAAVLALLGQADAAEKALAEGGASHDHGAEALLARARLARLRAPAAEALRAYDAARRAAQRGNDPDSAAAAAAEQARLLAAQGQPARAEPLLVSGAGAARVPPPAEAVRQAALAELRIAKGQAEAARQSALSALSLAEPAGARPVLFRAQLALGEALERLGRGAEAADAYARAASTLEWIRGSLLPEHVAAFAAHPDVRPPAERLLAALQRNGRTAEAAALAGWIGGASAAPAASR